MAKFSQVMGGSLVLLIVFVIALQLFQYYEEVHHQKVRHLEERMAFLENVLTASLGGPANGPKPPGAVLPGPEPNPPIQQPPTSGPSSTRPPTQPAAQPAPQPAPQPVPQPASQPAPQPAPQEPEHPPRTIEEIHQDDDLPFSEWRTRWKCYRREDFTDICVYENLCYDGEFVIFLNPDLDPHEDKLYKHPLVGPEGRTAYDWVYWEPHPFPPPMSKYVPYMSTYAGFDHEPYQMNPSSMEAHADSIELVAGGMYYAAHDMNPNNIWHASMQGLNLWDSQFLNDTLPDQEKLPPIDYVVLRRSFMWPGWERETYRAMAQPQTQFLFHPWYLSDTTHLEDLEGTLHVPIDFLDFEFTDADHINFSPKPREHANVPVSSKNMICSRRAVIVSQKPRLFSGQESAIRYRQAVYDRVGVPYPAPKGLDQTAADRERPKFSSKVMIDYRGDRMSRNLLNHDQLADLCEYYGLDPTVLRSYPDSETAHKQLTDLSQADVYIIVHGAGVTNAMFLPPRSTLIEVFPYGMRVPMYKEIAATLGIHYIEVVSWLKGPLKTSRCGGELYTTEFYEMCQNTSSVAHSLDRCVGLSKNACVVAPINSVEEALLSAYDFMGVNLNTRVDQLYSVAKNVQYNDFHAEDNFLWVANPWDVDPYNYPREFAWDHVPSNE